MPQWCLTLESTNTASKMKFQSGTPLGQFRKMPQWCPTSENTNTASNMKFQSGTPLGQFRKMPQWCPTSENIKAAFEMIFCLGHYWGISQICPSGVFPRSCIIVFKGETPQLGLVTTNPMSSKGAFCSYFCLGQGFVTSVGGTPCNEVS